MTHIYGFGLRVGTATGASRPAGAAAHHAAGVRISLADLRVAADWRYIGRQFDDDRNVFALDRSSMVDTRLGWIFKRGMEIFAAVENVLDEEQDVGRTPLRTIGLPRTSRVGLRFTLNRY